MGCGKKIAAAVHIDIIVFYFSKQYNEDKKGVCFYEVSEICRENGLKASLGGTGERGSIYKSN